MVHEVADPENLVLSGIIRDVIARQSARTWELDEGDFWFSVTPIGHRFPDQGWKLHVSATPLSAAITLARVGSILVRRGTAFKFAKDISTVATLASREMERGSCGKFVTVYPSSDEDFRSIMSELDEATIDLQGPRILSDKAIRAGSVLHYRYGVFGAPSVFTVDGTYESMLRRPDGTFVKDERNAWFTPPSWVEPPISEESTAKRLLPSPWIGRRFKINSAVRHTSSGSVYRAYDNERECDVIIKHARRYMDAKIDGTDARDSLKYEAEMLESLATLGVTPRRIALFEQQGDVFLAEECIPGETLQAAVAGHVEARTMSPERAFFIMRQLVEILENIHEAGFVLRDFTPRNVMVTPEGALRLIDLEHVSVPGQRIHRCYTLGYAAPEQIAAPLSCPAPCQTADLYSLGAITFYVATGVDPLFEDAESDFGSRLEERLANMRPDCVALGAVAPVIQGLLQQQPEHRWPLEKVRAFLSSAAPESEISHSRARANGPEAWGRLAADSVEHIRRTMTVSEARLWPTGEFGANTDATNVQHGAAGVLQVLLRAASAAPSPELVDAIRATAEWIDDRLYETPRILPGLYFGRAGTAWALYDASQYLSDARLTERALGLARKLPVHWGNPDVTHGIAGAGTTMLHLWRVSGEPDLQQRAIAYADNVLAAAEKHGNETLWPVSATFDSVLAGLTHYGYAHGVAGAGNFLLAAASATGRAAYLDAAIAAGETLSAVADVQDGRAHWPADGNPQNQPASFQHWCSGASGVGTFLIRLALVTGEERYAALAAGAANAVRRRAWRAGNSVCHGIAGDGEFLIDMAEFTGEARFQTWAEDVAHVLYTRRRYQNGLMVLGGEDPLEITADYNTGLSGIAGFLLRLQNGGPRWWMADHWLTRPTATSQTRSPSHGH
ncbi:class IV lanthionine synthetase LanL [Streptomyces virginiae]|uniref:class IV lanthionine synthetase LanL n=1 Tax=Streptomyces virginiae TaxID=1961 RepID=UPI00131A686D|nr:class IV lanthionine synthetase LanL [Streptomyces virginiae]